MKHWEGSHVLIITEDVTFDGKLLLVKKEVLVMTDVRALVSNQQPQVVDGRVVIPRDRVIWMQVP